MTREISSDELDSLLVRLIEQHTPTERQLGKLLNKKQKKLISDSGRPVHIRLRYLRNIESIHQHTDGTYSTESEYLF